MSLTTLRNILMTDSLVPDCEDCRLLKCFTNRPRCTSTQSDRHSNIVSVLLPLLHYHVDVFICSDKEGVPTGHYRRVRQKAKAHPVCVGVWHRSYQPHHYHHRAADERQSGLNRVLARRLIYFEGDRHSRKKLMTASIALAAWLVTGISAVVLQILNVRTPSQGHFDCTLQLALSHSVTH